MKLGKQLKVKFIDKINKIVLPKTEFKSTIGDKYQQRFSGKVLMNRLRVYAPNSWAPNRLHLIVDVNVFGYCVLRKSYRTEEEMIEALKTNIDSYSLYSTSSKICLTNLYDTLSRKEKMGVTSRIKVSLADSIEEYIKALSIKEGLKEYGDIVDVKIGKITYE